MTDCIVCGGTYLPSRLPGLLRCQSCQFTTANLELSAQELSNLYAECYFRGGEYRDYVDERAIIERNFKRRLKYLLRHVPDPSSKNLFEIGSAYGFFLSICRGTFAAVEGVDISGDAVRFAAQELHLPVAEADFLNYTPANPIDVACMWDTIEHLEKPHLYIKKLARLMRSGGIIAITTGDLDSLVARWRGKRWRQIHPPSHLHYFSRNTLIRLLNDHEFQVLDTRYDGTYRTADTVAYVLLNIKHHLPGVYRALKRSYLLNWSLYLNLHDIVYVIAVKKMSVARVGARSIPETAAPGWDPIASLRRRLRTAARAVATKPLRFARNETLVVAKCTGQSWPDVSCRSTGGPRI